MFTNENKLPSISLSALPSLILYEDDDILVIDKPAGLIINTAQTHHQLSLQDLVAQYLDSAHQTFSDQIPAALLPADYDPQFGSPLDIWQERRGLVHRLDKDTSGVTVWAKNPTSLLHLLSQFRQRTTSKTYLCLVHGLFPADKMQDRINLPLARKPSNRQLMAVTAVGGRTALTLYQVQKSWPQFDFSRLQEHFAASFPDQNLTLKKRELDKLYQGFSLVQAMPKTGRTHQIRAHFTHLKHPLVGDQSYLSHKKARIDQLWCPRQFLHAQSLSFTHPVSQQPLTFTSPLPQDLQTALTFLQDTSSN